MHSSQGQVRQDSSPGSEQNFDVRYAQHRHARTSVITNVAVVIAQAIVIIGIVIGIVVVAIVRVHDGGGRRKLVVAQHVVDAVEAA